MVKKNDSLLFRLFRKNSSPLYVIEIENNDIKGVNNAALRQYGYSEEEFLSLNLEDLQPENENTGSMSNTNMHPSFSGNVGIRKHKKKNGDIIFVDITVEPLNHEGKQFKIVHAKEVSHPDISNESYKDDSSQTKVLNNDISEQLDLLEQEIQSGASDLSEQKELIHTALENLPGLFYMINDDQEYILWNKNFEEMLGYNKEEIIKSNPLDIYREEDRELVYIKMEKAIDGHTVIFEAGIYDQKGYPVPHHITSRKFVVDKNIYIITSAINITERKGKEMQLIDALQQKAVLFHEIHHRVKNNLAVISGLLYMQSLYTDQEDVRTVLSESQLRVKTMALIHEQLYQSDSSSNIDYKLYLNKLVQSISEVFDPDDNIKLKIDCESFEMPLNQAIPCSLLINEIMTNAYKYAFGNTKKGNVLIRVRTDGDKVVVVVKDDGEGLPDDFEVKKKKSFGFTIIETLLKQLKGDYKVKNNDGVEFLFSFKMKDSANPKTSP